MIDCSRAIKLTFLYQTVVMNRGILWQKGYCRSLASLSKKNSRHFRHKLEYHSVQYTRKHVRHDCVNKLNLPIRPDS